MYRLLLAIFWGLLCATSASYAAGTTPHRGPDGMDPAITAMAMGRKGELIVATGDGRICALRRDGDRVVLASGMTGICALALSPRGDIYAGSATDGTVSRLDRQGHVEAIGAGLDGLRCLTVDRDGTVFVVHGPEGEITILGSREGAQRLTGQE